MTAEKGTISINTENIFPIIKKFLYSDHEIFLRESRDGGEKSAILREKQEPGQDWLCLSLEQGPEGTNLSLNSSHGDEGSQLEFRANGQFDASYNQGREVFSVIANSDSVGVITSTGAGRMSQARLGSALQSHQANVALADSRVGGFLANL